MKTSMKSLNLPKPIATYFAADKNDSETLSQCFTENAVVKDEGHTYKGRAAIKQWKTGTSTNTNTPVSPSRGNKRKERPSSPADSREIFLAAPLTFDFSS